MLGAASAIAAVAELLGDEGLEPEEPEGFFGGDFAGADLEAELLDAFPEGLAAERDFVGEGFPPLLPLEEDFDGTTMAPSFARGPK